MTRNRSGCWTQDPARIFHNMCFIRKARKINETILASSHAAGVLAFDPCTHARVLLFRRFLAAALLPH